MYQWLIETFGADDRIAKTYLVKAKTYGEACAVIAKYDQGNYTFRSLGCYEQLATEKHLSRRIG